MRTYATILALLLTVPAYAVDTLKVTTPDPMTEAWRWTEFDKSSGIAGVVRNIYEARDRSIWIATEQGVQRYDGLRWTTYTTDDGLGHNGVSVILQTRDGAMWFGTNGGGISRFDPEKSGQEPDGWTTYNTADGLPTNWLHGDALLQARDGTLWAGFGSQGLDGTQGGISRFDPSAGSGQAAWTTVEVPGDTPRPSIVMIHEAADGALWFTTVGHGVLRFDPSAGSGQAAWRRYTSADGLAGNVVTRMLEARDGSFWYACYRDGVSRFDGSGWTTYRSPEGLDGNVWSVWQHQDGSVWAGGGRGMIYRYEGERWRAYGPEDVPSLGALVRSESASDGSIWFWGHGQSKAFRFDPGSTRWTVYTDVPSTIGSGEAADVLTVIDDELWLTAPDGAVRFDGRVWTKFTPVDGLIDGPVTTILKARDGSVWAGGQHGGRSGAARFDGERWHVFSAEDGLAGDNIYTGLAAGNGDVWFGTKWGSPPQGAGVMRYDGKGWSNYTTEDGLIDNQIYGIAQTLDGTIWIGTNGGLSGFNPQSGSGQSAWSSYSVADGLVYRKVRTMIAAKDGVLWIGQAAPGHGVLRHDGRSLMRAVVGGGVDDVGVWTIHEANDGAFWFGTVTGLHRSGADGWNVYPFDEEVLDARFGSAARGLVESPAGTFWLRRPDRVVRFVPDSRAPETMLETATDRVASSGNILLRWSGRDLWDDTSIDEMRYEWRMDNDDWSPASPLQAFTFTSLTDGDHRFEVRAVGRYGNFDDTPAVHAFVVEAPWWRNPVVAGPGLLLIIGIIFQSARVVQAKRKLQDSVDALSSANNELFQVNRDLESVNVDLQREQVLERLRGQAQGMQSSEDIRPMVEAVYRELGGLGLPLLFSALGSSVSETEVEHWITREDGRVLEPYVTGGSAGPREEARRRGDDYFHLHCEGGEVKQRLRRQIERGHPRWKDVPEDQWPQKMDTYNVFVGERGVITLASGEPIAEEYLMLIKRFGEVFGYAHSRYKELQEKEAQNRRLAVEASVQRLRAEVQSMDEASDFERILSLLTDSLKTVELTFDGCEIDVLDEPVENPTMVHFETNGFRYTTFRLDPDGNVAPQSYNVPAPFQPVNQQTIERFIAGEPWQGLSDDIRIVEVPAGSYGRLRLTETDREQFAEDEVATLREFADAVALGYARYLDIREIQLNTERKSEFLASMSHELRTPMNTIKGFTNFVLRRDKSMEERSPENLQKVTQASDRLLAMIDDLLDLSKIEAGSMDVNPERFDVRELVTSACDTVSPLIQEGVELRQDVADDIGAANTDKARVQQMVINLLSNAIKFTDAGSVTVTASRGPSSAEATAGRQGAGSGGEDLVISVSDTGKGIPADELPTIFDEYRQAEGSESSVQKGTGLGLSITRKFAELLGGAISVVSEIGKGSTFTVSVPADYEGET